MAKYIPTRKELALMNLIYEAMKIIDRASMFGLDHHEAQKWYTKAHKLTTKTK